MSLEEARLDHMMGRIEDLEHQARLGWLAGMLRNEAAYVAGAAHSSQLAGSLIRIAGEIEAREQDMAGDEPCPPGHVHEPADTADSRESVIVRGPDMAGILEIAVSHGGGYVRMPESTARDLLRQLKVIFGQKLAIDELVREYDLEEDR